MDVVSPCLSCSLCLHQAWICQAEWQTEWLLMLCGALPICLLMKHSWLLSLQTQKTVFVMPTADAFCAFESKSLHLVPPNWTHAGHVCQQSLMQECLLLECTRHHLWDVDGGTCWSMSNGFFSCAQRTKNKFIQIAGLHLTHLWSSQTMTMNSWPSIAAPTTLVSGSYNNKAAGDEACQIEHMKCFSSESVPSSSDTAHSWFAVTVFKTAPGFAPTQFTHAFCTVFPNTNLKISHVVVDQQTCGQHKFD